ncbi:malto-oligosyltrehalose synthase [Terracidiphilus gabretensis]|uniref:malto-oligosyltrehalose synthase n=1 Tax=Terracidiphilus gabretensis TaxID=1577687 RepID=UPI00071B30BA|nr:malto-oligosyltrehalose synthase [Terracidiphilus gabretensis]
MTGTIASCYRLQLHTGFTFADAAQVAGYLKELGLSHVYCSPYLQSAKGSQHGYDVVDQQKVNVEIGGEEGHAHFCASLKELGLGQILDIVPNHMATGPGNKYWCDVLENGASSRFASWFDIDWNSAEVKLQNKVLIPVLGDQYGRELSAGRIAIHYDGESFQVRYMGHAFPLSPISLAAPLSMAAEAINAPMLGFIADTLGRLPSPGTDEHELRVARHRDKTVLCELLHRYLQENPGGSEAIENAVGVLNKDYDALDAILNLQHYRLAYWRTADQELGYRRFFDVNTLIGVRAERQHVFNATHRRILEWLRSGVLDGVRVDHPDGLRDPEEYFARLRASAPEAWIVAEKILQPGEFLRASWPIDGTTGYDFLNVCNGVLIHSEGLKEITDIYQKFIGELQDFEALAHTKKLAVQQEALGSDVNRLTQEFVEICENNRDRRDYTRAEIRRAIREVAACFAVYRTYVIPQRNQITDEDRSEISNAVSIAKIRRTDVDPGLFDFIGDVLSLQSRGEKETEFLLRFQQFTSPVMAKGVEDTVFYCFNRMIGLNEVGAAPGRNGVALDEFHAYCAKMHVEHPQTMNTLSTHDTKRSDDVRARLAVLTEMPGQWRGLLRRWSRMNRQFKTGQFPDSNTEYFLYQTLIGSWPISKERITAYMEKAVREAKQNTSWTQQNKEFEDALRHFIEQILDYPQFITELENFVAQILLPGRINGLAQTLIKFTAPGVPDTYQGSELWDLRLVDPDNRGPVDYEVRRSMLAELQAGMPVEEILKRIDSGMPKLWVIYKALHLRRERPDCFNRNSSYSPLTVEGSKKEHLIAYLRGESVAVVVSRWNARLAGNFASTVVQIPGGRWNHLLTGESFDGGSLRAQNLLRRFPVALLVRSEE